MMRSVWLFRWQGTIQATRCPYPHLALADVLERQKKFNDAAECFKIAEQMARQAGDPELAEAIALRRVKQGPYNS